MDQRIALVTGGMGGLGEAICMKLARMGIKVVVTYSPGNTKHAEWLKEMAARDYHFHAYACDVSDFEDCQRTEAKISEEVGPIDILINNAGITRDMTFKKMGKVDWDAVMKTNLDSVFNMTKPVVDAMVERGWGRVVNIASDAGRVGSSMEAVYSACKGGIIAMTKTLARELATKGILVNAAGDRFINEDAYAFLVGAVEIRV